MFRFRSDFVMCRSHDWWVLDTVETDTGRLYEVHRTSTPGKLCVVPMYRHDDLDTWNWLGHLLRMDWPRGYMVGSGSYYDNDDTSWVLAKRGTSRQRLTDGGIWVVTRGLDPVAGKTQINGYEAAVCLIIAEHERTVESNAAAALLAMSGAEDAA